MIERDFDYAKTFEMKMLTGVDDVMHNTVGCLIGWLVVKGSWLMVKR